jgi:hypothetical protein
MRRKKRKTFYLGFKFFRVKKDFHLIPRTERRERVKYKTFRVHYGSC